MLGSRLALSFFVVALASAALAAVVAFSPSTPAPVNAEQLAAYRQEGSARRAAAAGVPMDPEPADQIAHYHVRVQLLIDGAPYAAPADLGTPDTPGGALAIHAHDRSGIVHLHLPKGTSKFTLSDVQAVWGLNGRLLQDNGLASQVWVGSKKLPSGADPVLADHDDIVIEIASGGNQLSERRALDLLDWSKAPVDRVN